MKSKLAQQSHRLETFDHEALEISWLLPGSKSDHVALGVTRSWPCLCGLENFFCPYHLTTSHWAWLTASVHFTAAADTPLFPTESGNHPNKVQVVDTFEALGAAMGQPLQDHVGTRRFGGHTPRVTGARILVAGGMDLNTVRIMARHSGDTILRYVAEAPLKSLRADLGLSSIPGAETPSMHFMAGDKHKLSAIVRARVQKLEDALTRLEGIVQAQAQDVVALATGFARTDNRVYVQNTCTATIHMARCGGEGRTICGWPYARARARGPELPFRTVNSLVDIPGMLLCEKCLPTERAVAVGRFDAELSADEL